MQHSNFTLINEAIEEEEQVSNNTSRSDTSTTDNIFDKRKTTHSWFTDEDVEDFDKQHPFKDHTGQTLADDTISHQFASNYSSPSSCSSSLYQDDSINTESILIKNALKSSQRKRRESVSDIHQSKKRPFSMSVLPKQHAPSISESRTKNHLRNNRRKYYSLQPLSQHEKNKLASLINDNESGGVHWDPHIDAFEILRAKITGITRSMQQFHVQELFQDELLADERRKRLSIFPNTTISTPLHTATKSNLVTNRRFSLANLSASDTTNSSPRRIRSQSFTPNERAFEQEKEFLNNLINQDDKARNDEDDDEEDDERLLTSPNLTALFLTTNNLISSRLDELSETASIKSNNETDTNEQLEWQKKFLSLVTSCIQQSEALESLSTDLLNAEHRVRELMLVKDTIHEQFQEREKQYEERIRECQEIAQQQLMMIDSLEELNADIDMKLETSRREAHRQEALKALDGRRHEEDEPDDTSKRWDFRKSVAELLHMDEKQDIIHKMRWEIGMYVGGGVGTGHIIHTFEDKLNGIDMMIAGTGSTSTSPNDFYHQMSSDSDQDSINNEHSVTISSNIQHIGLYQHNYIIHLNNQDRRTRFLLLPRSLWVPDEAATQCQFHTRKKRCPTQFTLFNRRHHCRKCGLVICQRHSANRLPLFHPSKIYSTTGQWSRVCDTCFYALIIQK